MGYSELEVPLRVVRAVGLLVVVVVGGWLLIAASPIDPVRAYIGTNTLRVSPEQRAAIAARWGFDTPLPKRFINWIQGVLRGDWGWSHIYNEPVSDILWSRFIISLPLMVGAWLGSGLLGFGAGLACGFPSIDRIVRPGVYAMSAAPVFWLAVLALVGAGYVGLPVCCAVPLGVVHPTIAQRIQHLLVPTLVLSLSQSASLALHVRQSVIELQESDWAIGARINGKTRGQILWQHVARNALLPAVALHATAMSEIFGGSVLVETVFSYPGIAGATVAASLRHDVALLMGVVIFSAVFVLLSELCMNVALRHIDPRRV